MCELRGYINCLGEKFIYILSYGIKMEYYIFKKILLVKIKNLDNVYFDNLSVTKLRWGRKINKITFD